MANQGLVNYGAYKQFLLSNGVTVQINLCNEYKNIHLCVPILEELKEFGLNFSISFNYQNKENIGVFGRGFSIPLRTEFVKNENNALTIKQDDGIIQDFEYFSDDTFYSKKLKLYSRYYSLIIYNNYDIFDFYGNVWEYSSMFPYMNFPKRVKSRKYEYSLLSSLTFLEYNRDDSKERIFIYLQDSKISKISYEIKNNNDEYENSSTYEFTYNDDSYLINIKEIKDNTVCSNTNFFYESNCYRITDLIKNETIKCELINGNIVVSQYHNNINVAIVHNINYDTEKTIITNSYQENLTYVFENNLVKYIFDDRFHSNIFTFDSDCNLTKKQINLAYDDEKKTILGENLSDYTVTNEVDSSSDYPTSSITNVFYMHTNSKIEQQKNFISYVRESLCLSFLTKSEDSGKIKATLKINDSTTKIITIEPKTFYHPASINLFFDGVIERVNVCFEVLSGNCYVAGIKLAPTLNEFDMQYNNQGLVMSKSSGGHVSNLSYNENNYLLSRSGNNFLGTTQVYNDKNLIYERINGVEKEYNYSEQQDLIKEKIIFYYKDNEESHSETIVENYTYSNHYLTSVLDHNNVSYQIINDIVKKEIKKVIVNGITTTYKYDGLDYHGPTFEGPSMTKDNLISYNAQKEVFRYNHVVDDNIINQYLFNYNEDLNLKSVKENDLEYGILDYENEDSETLPHTGRVKVVIYGNERDEYTYDYRGNVTRKNINYSIIYDYSYNYLNQLKEIKRGSDVIEEFDYDIRNQLVSHRINNGINHTFLYKPACTKFSNNLCSEQYQTFSSQSGKTKDGIYNYYYHLGYATFFDYKKCENNQIVNQKSLIHKTDKVSEYSAEHTGEIYYDDEVFNYLNLENDEVGYIINNISSQTINVHFWYKPSELENNTIAVIKLNDYPYVLSLEDGRVKIVYQGLNLKPNIEVKSNEWNLISLSFNGSAQHKIGIGLNLEYDEDNLTSSSFPRFTKIELQFKALIKAKISGIVVTKTLNMLGERNTYYELINELTKTKVNCSGLMMYNSSVDYYPLLNSYNSLNDNKPYNYESNDYSNDFIYDTDLRRSVYYTHGQKMFYLLNGFSFSISFRFKMLDFGQYNPILSIASTSSLYVACNIDGQILLNNELINKTIDSNWHTLKYTYIMGTGAKLKIDDFVYNFSGSAMYGNTNLYLGYEYENKYSLARFCDLVYKSGSETTDSDYNAYGVINIYDNLGRLNCFKKIDENKTLVSLEYNKDLVSKVSIKNNQNSFDEYNYEYQFINGNPVVNKIIYQEEAKNEFVYDEFGRLIKEIRGNNEDNYSYDIRGNITSKNGVTYYYESPFMDRVTKIGNYTISYDVIGNISSYKGVNYSYTGRKLTSVTSNDLSISFVYNDINQRIKKINDLTGEVTYYVYENDLLKFEYTGNNWISYLHLDGKVIGFIKNGGSPYYYIYDGIGNIVSIMNSNNERVVNYEYDGFGNVLSITGPENSSLGIPNHFRYKGYYYDTETNLYFLNTRYYSPELCRFISPDSVDYLDPDSINGLNLYSYCMNNPIIYADPSGHSAILIGLIIGALIGFGTAAYIDYQDDGQIFNGSIKWYDYLGATVLGGAIGAGLVAFAGMSFSASIPTFGWVNSGGALIFGVTGTVAFTVTGAQVLGVAGLLGVTYMFTKGNGPRMGHNQYENKQFNSLCNKYKLTKEQRRILHDYISGQNYSYKEIEQLIIELFFS